MAQDHFLVCFTISPTSLTMVAIRLLLMFFFVMPVAMSVLSSHGGYIVLMSNYGVLVSRFAILVLVLQMSSCLHYC